MVSDAESIQVSRPASQFSVMTFSLNFSNVMRFNK